MKAHPPDDLYNRSTAVVQVISGESQRQSLELILFVFMTVT